MPEFFEATFESNLQPVYFACQGAIQMTKYYGINHRLMVMECKNGVGVWINRLNDLQEIGDKLADRFLNELGFWERIDSLWRQKKKTMEKIYAKIAAQNLSKLTDDQLLALYDEFCGAYLDFWTQGMCADPMHFGLDNRFQTELRKLLSENGRDNKYITSASALLNPTRASFIGEEEEAFRKIVDLAAQKKADEEDGEIKRLLEEHAARYYWIENTYAKTRVVSADDFLEKLKVMLKEGTPVKRKTQSKLIEERDNALEKLNAPAEFRKLVELMDYMTFFQDERKRYTLIANHWLDVLLSEIGRRKGYTLEELKSALPSETQGIFKGKTLDHEEIAERVRYNVSIYFDGGLEVFTGAQAKKQLEKIGFSKEYNKTNQVYGICASIGTATGRVKIVFTSQDVVKMEYGDVMVTSMTRPELVPGMKKASAIVTDEGGLTCHAAILSRELGKPCVIGCVNATHVLKDGDLVEVNAAQGTVKKIS